MADINNLKSVLTKRNGQICKGEELKNELVNITNTIKETKYENIIDTTKKVIVELLNSAIKLLDKPNDTTNKMGFSNALENWKDIKQSDSNVFSALLDPVRNLVQHVNKTIENLK